MTSSNYEKWKISCILECNAAFFHLSSNFEFKNAFDEVFVGIKYSGMDLSIDKIGSLYLVDGVFYRGIFFVWIGGAH